MQSLRCWHLELALVGLTRSASGRYPVYRTPFSVLVLVPSRQGTADTADMAHMADTAHMVDTADMATRGITAGITAVMAEVTMDEAGAGSLLSS